MIFNEDWRTSCSEGGFTISARQTLEVLGCCEEVKHIFS